MDGYAEGRTGPAPRKLTAAVIEPAEVSRMHRQRVEQTRAAMAHHGLDMLAVPPGDDLRDLANFSTLADERPSYLFLTADAALFLVPELNAQQSRAHIQDPMVTYTDADGPGTALAAARARLGSARRNRAGRPRGRGALRLPSQPRPGGGIRPGPFLPAPLRMRKSSEEIEALRRA